MAVRTDGVKSTIHFDLRFIRKRSLACNPYQHPSSAQSIIPFEQIRSIGDNGNNLLPVAAHLAGLRFNREAILARASAIGPTGDKILLQGGVEFPISGLIFAPSSMDGFLIRLGEGTLLICTSAAKDRMGRNAMAPSQAHRLVIMVSPDKK